MNAFKIKSDGTLEDENTYFNLRYGTNILEHRIPFDPITLKYFVVKKNDVVTLKTMENEPSSLQDSDIRVEWYSVENDKRTKKMPMAQACMWGVWATVTMVRIIRQMYII